MAFPCKRVLIACGLPIIAVVSLYWLRKRRRAISDRRSQSQQSVNCSNVNSIESIVVEMLDQSETYCDSQIDIKYKMQLRDNNNTCKAGNAVDDCESASQDFHSEGSSDSGNGGSDILQVNSSEVASREDVTDTVDDSDNAILYQFEIPQYLCGRLIGMGGRFVTLIKRNTNTQVTIYRHHYSSDLKICTLTGTKSEIRDALNMIRNKFPLNDYPNLSLQQINLITPGHTCPLPQTCRLQLPVGIACDVILSSLVSAGHFFLQQPTHPTYPSLSRLDQCMSTTYSQFTTPTLPHSRTGMICAVPMMGGWFRAVINKVTDNSDECDVMFVDYGGFSRVATSSLRQIRYDFMSLPFQATECYLANVEPVDSENGWTQIANDLFEELAQGQIIQALIVGFASDGIPLVHLFKVQGASNVFINQELVNQCHAHWVDINTA